MKFHQRERKSGPRDNRTAGGWIPTSAARAAAMAFGKIVGRDSRYLFGLVGVCAVTPCLGMVLIQKYLRNRRFAFGLIDQAAYQVAWGHAMGEAHARTHQSDRKPSTVPAPSLHTHGRAGDAFS